MSGSTTADYGRAFAMGLIAGLRSMSAPALFSAAASRKHNGALTRTPFDTLTSPRTAAVLGALAVGEMVVDKLPKTPSRTIPPSVIFRALSGALVGAAYCEEQRKPLATGALLGALGAVAATYGAYYLRQAADHKTGLPDPVVAFIEDAITVGAGLGVMRSA
jgi:uncharacterized membrane protein